MGKRVIILRYGEIFLKGKNRSYFESLLIKNIKYSLDKLLGEGKYSFNRSQARYSIEDYDEIREAEIVDRLTKVFGIHSLSVAVKVPSDSEHNFAAIKEVLKPLAEELEEENVIKNATFRVTVKRADKRISMPSYEIAAELAGTELKYTSFKVNLKKFDYDFEVDIRETGDAYVFSKVIPCAGGLPVGCSSKGMLLLSGGIDSPVAAYMMAKRGMKLVAVHFASPPYTSELAKQKVKRLRDIVEAYTTHMKLYVVPFTNIQLAIHEHCPAEYMITIMRRFMMRIATKLAASQECKAIITGESLGQVASQTVESMTSTESCAGLPIFRPLIAFDKEETMDIAKKIGTYDTSIEPYEDCCTVFLPKNPAIKPRLERVAQAEQALDIDALVEEAMKNIEVL